jgi:uncharacterized protein YgiM (DUF1202 family)
MSGPTILLKSPVDNAKIIDSVLAGTKIKLLDEDAGWKKAELPNGKQGWIENTYLEAI